MKILVTGCFGFIGINFLKYALKNKKHKIVGVDKLTYASNKKYKYNFLKNKNFVFYKIDINSKKIENIINKEKPTHIINFAAESHVDNSITKPEKFIISNINGVYNLLYFSLKYYNKLKPTIKNKFRFIQISTDEVYGSISNGLASEKNKYIPNSPYSASKASADHLVNAWNITYGLPTIITNSCNNYGPFQNKEKLIPKTIASIFKNKEILLYGNGKNIREWIYVEDHILILYNILKKGKVGNTYNIGSNFRISNIDLIKVLIKKYCEIKNNKDEKKIIDKIKYIKDRLGHDYRYALNTNKLKKLYKIKNLLLFEEGLLKTLNWYNQNK